jgi:hypothetical protein
MRTRPGNKPSAARRASRPGLVLIEDRSPAFFLVDGGRSVNDQRALLDYDDFDVRCGLAPRGRTPSWSLGVPNLGSGEKLGRAHLDSAEVLDVAALDSRTARVLAHGQRGRASSTRAQRLYHVFTSVVQVSANTTITPLVTSPSDAPGSRRARSVEWCTRKGTLNPVPYLCANAGRSGTLRSTDQKRSFRHDQGRHGAQTGGTAEPGRGLVLALDRLAWCQDGAQAWCLSDGQACSVMHLMTYATPGEEPSRSAPRLDSVSVSRPGRRRLSLKAQTPLPHEAAPGGAEGWGVRSTKC